MMQLVAYSESTIELAAYLSPAMAVAQNYKKAI